jgi:hypothetical protein
MGDTQKFAVSPVWNALSSDLPATAVLDGLGMKCSSSFWPLSRGTYFRSLHNIDGGASAQVRATKLKCREAVHISTWTLCTGMHDKIRAHKWINVSRSLLRGLVLLSPPCHSLSCSTLLSANSFAAGLRVTTVPCGTFGLAPLLDDPYHD